MSKKKRFKMPNPDEIKNHRSLRLVKRFLEDPHLWRFTRGSISRGVFIGLFWCFMPMPFQMIAAVITGVIFRANLILAVVLCWISNPITMPPMLYGCYKLGVWLLDRPGGNFPKSFSIDNLVNALQIIWQPLVLGSLVAAVITAFIGYVLSFVLWTWIANRMSQSDDKNA